MTRPYSTRSRRAVTLTELLVVLLIISLLATIAVPVYLTKIRAAKIATATAEVRELAHAEEHCVLLHGFYVPLQMLDDIIYDQAIHRGVALNDPLATDDLYNEWQQIQLIDPAKVVEYGIYNEHQPELQDRSNDVRVESLYSFWSGPFINFHRDFAKQWNAANPASRISVYFDHPLDPWGQPYRFYSPVGIIGTNAYSTTPSDWRQTSFSDGNLTTTDDRFDRFAIVSFGPDGEDAYSKESTVNGTQNDDDVVYLFSGFFNESSFRIFY
ncbi:prepilin-type N-terminal cleavage/methylation domain-containing protein [Candidatus Sumerlaeota bacterium]|nr:prepilin-type N-terminal cleavage/methylation domain-containing protein [Candidatus Sumerlaeota bacterium]